MSAREQGAIEALTEAFDGVRAERDALRTELERTEGDLAVAIREATDARAALRRENGQAQIGDRVKVTLVGELVAYDAEIGHWTLRGHSIEGHVDWDYTLHWGTRFEVQS